MLKPGSSVVFAFGAFYVVATYAVIAQDPAAGTLVKSLGHIKLEAQR